VSVVGPITQAVEPLFVRPFGREGLLRILCGSVTVLALLSWCVDLGQPFRGDEIHFAQTIEKFGESPSFELLAHYEEMSGPLPFLLYGAWGRLFGYDPLTLRLLSLLVAVVTYALWFRLSAREFASARGALLATACFLLQPYLLFVSLFVYTDMLAMLFLLMALIALREERPLLLCAGIAGALVCRQHLVFLPLAAGLFLALKYRHGPRWRGLCLLAGCCAGTLPLMGLLALWEGPCPDNALKQTYLAEGTSFHIESAWLYLSLSAIYLAPALVWKRHSIFASRRMLAVAVLISLLYWLTPITPSPSAIAAGIPHVGMFHKTLASLLRSPMAVHFIFWLALIPGLLTYLFLSRDLLRRCARRTVEFPVFLDLAVLAFLAVMPWAYLHWEKYLLPLVPILIARLTWDWGEDVRGWKIEDRGSNSSILHSRSSILGPPRLPHPSEAV
jgi:4-amino-4-deoxy-L-arabinose transferase-like glycosyltransferase